MRDIYVYEGTDVLINKLDIRDFESLLNYQLSKYYIYKYQAQYKDGYIQKR